jgi:hypothetical protein
MNDRAYIFYASMAKHKHDLGNYQFCSEEGSDHDLKYSLLALRVMDKNDNKGYIFGGSCVPSGCTEEEIRDGFESQMENQYVDSYSRSEGLTVTFPDSKEPTIGPGTIMTIIIYSIIGIIIIFGTVVDINAENADARRESVIDEHQKKTKLGNFLRSFSIPRNFSRIFFDDFTMNNELRIFNGIFVISLILVILNNIYFISIMYGIVEGSKLQDYESLFPQFTLLRLQLSYDAYFFSIGFTCCVKLWTLFFVNEHKGYILVELFRYMYRRFIPMVFLLLYAMFIFQFMGDGPLYQFCYNTWIMGTSQSPLCKTKWWAPLIFGASVYTRQVDEQCLSWLWVVSNEVFFFMILVLVFWAYKYKPLFGYLTCIFFISASVIIIFAETYAYGYSYTSDVSRWVLALIKITPINACASYVVGIIYGLIWFSYQNQGDSMH